MCTVGHGTVIVHVYCHVAVNVHVYCHVAVNVHVYCHVAVSVHVYYVSCDSRHTCVLCVMEQEMYNNNNTTLFIPLGQLYMASSSIINMIM